MFALILLIRVAGAVYVPISDCDEVYNYWEPLHHLLYGSGKQTWEYSSQFALRSYLFLWIYGAVGWVFEAMTGGFVAKVTTYYLVRGAAAVASALAEWYLVEGVSQRFGAASGRFLWLFCATGTGLAKASASFLPSSFAMVCYFAAAGGWVRFSGHLAEGARSLETRVTVTAIVASAVVGWPFAALVGVPIGLHALTIHNGFAALASWLVASTAVLSVAVAAVDSAYYCRLVFSPWNIIEYNVFASADGRGPELYGVEPWTFFFKNLALNFNAVFIIALFGPALAAAGAVLQRVGQRAKRWGEVLLFGSPFYLWFAFWLRIPHKEERFMAPAYPFMLLAAALMLGSGLQLRSPFSGRLRTLGNFVALTVIVLSTSRTVGEVYFYGGFEEAVAETFRSSQAQAVGSGSANVLCLSGDWFRFPSQFFLPRAGVSYGFVKSSGFSGALPMDFQGANGSCQPNLLLNDRNLAVEAQFTPLSRCSVVIDVARGHEWFADGAEPLRELPDAAPRAMQMAADRYSQISSERFAIDSAFAARRAQAPLALLDPGRTPLWCRLGYIPLLTARCARWSPIVVLRRHP